MNSLNGTTIINLESIDITHAFAIKTYVAFIFRMRSGMR